MEHLETLKESDYRGGGDALGVEVEPGARGRKAGEGVLEVGDGFAGLELELAGVSTAIGPEAVVVRTASASWWRTKWPSAVVRTSSST